MLPLPQEYVGSMTEVKSMSNDLLAVGRIIKIDKEALEIMANEDDRMPLLQYRTPVKLFAHHPHRPTRILVGVVYLSTENFSRMEEVKALQDFERRGAFRVNTNVMGHITALLTPEEQAAFDEAMAMALPARARELQAQHEFDVKVLDISLTGIRFFSAQDLSMGKRFYIEFSLLKTNMSFYLQVQRRIEVPKGGFQYGCIFFDYSERQMNVLCRELFQLQRYEKNRRRNPVTSI